MQWAIDLLLIFAIGIEEGWKIASDGTIVVSDWLLIGYGTGDVRS
jgi:hypothetical protein